MTSEITFADAIRQALQEEMRRDESVFLMGEDIGKYGGLFKTTKGLMDEFGESRVIDTPLSESAIVGAGIGAAITGMHPVVEIQFTDLLTIAMDQIVNNAAKMRYLSGGKISVPLVIRAVHGAGAGAGAHHSQSVEAWFANVPGLKLVMPSNPTDAKGLLKSSIRDGNPVLFFEHKRLYFTKGDIPDDDYVIPLGQAKLIREGKDITIVATGAMVNVALQSAEQAIDEGISIEVIDPRTLIPLDKHTIINSVRKTSRLIVLEEACKTGGFGGEIAAIVAEEAFNFLDAPIRRIGAPYTPVPANKVLEMFYVPDVERVIKVIHELVL